MARRIAPPQVDHTYLVQAERAAEAILVGSAAWYAWLTGATSFAFVGEYGNFTAYKEYGGPNVKHNLEASYPSECLPSPSRNA